jgi:hydrogenase maturation protein HypF
VITRLRLRVHGIVQGVGFRPWVHQLAVAAGLSGFVKNTGNGVEIEVEGEPASIDRFRQGFAANLPPLAVVDLVEADPITSIGSVDFEILSSGGTARETPFVLIPPDIATCEACLRELREPSDRRFEYPFLNCTHCGPRYTILRGIPYDRPNTTMAGFEMCAECAAEYRDPSNRRFHAQPVACPKCGPRLELVDRAGQQMGERESAIAQAKALLADGHVVAIKGLGGFHLACLPTHEAAVAKLRSGKRRSGKPFAIMIRDLEAAGALCEMTEDDQRALLSPRRPIVLMLRRSPRAEIADGVAPGLSWLGLILPYTPLHHLLFDGAPYSALVMTSGNLSEEPISCLDEDVSGRLHGLAEYFLVHNREIHVPADDSVVRTFAGRERVIRRSRGYAPHPIDLGFEVQPILAVGGELKNTFCLTRQHYAILSQHIGDLENLETLQVFERSIEHMRRFFHVDPVAVAHDMHPQYLSTQYASGLDLPKVAVQHHHAHIAACMAENRLDGTVTGVALDGTGYGTDGKIWGGEFLECSYAEFRRRLHFRYVPLAGGDTAVKQTWRAGLAYLRDAGVATLPVPIASQRDLAVVDRMIERRINAVETSSCGRLFDAVASILGVRQEASYEGQAAMELEALAIAEGPAAEPFPFHIVDGEIDFRDMIRELTGSHRPAARFHETLARVIVEACRFIGNERVCLSGGVFQNFTLLGRARQLLLEAGFQVYVHALVPPNDGGIALGQAVVANALLADAR